MGWDIKIKNIPPWSYPDAAAAGAAAATSAADSAAIVFTTMNMVLAFLASAEAAAVPTVTTPRNRFLI